MRNETNSSPGNEGPRLDDVNLSFHVGPLDVLVAAAEDALDRCRRTHQPANYVVSQHHASTCDRHLLNTAFFVKRQQAVFRGPRQNLHGVGSRTKDYLLRNLLTLHYLYSKTPFCADIDGPFVLGIEGIGAYHDTRTFGVDSLLQQYGHEDLRVVYTASLASFVSFKVPEGCPDCFDRVNDFLFTANVWNRCVEPGATEIRQVFRI